MSGSFSGFTEDDIRNLRDGGSQKVQKAQGKKIVQEKRTSNRIHSQTTAINHKILEEKIKDSATQSIPESAKLSPNSNSVPKTPETQPDPENKNETEEKKVIVIGEPEVPERKRDLAEFQERQKLIEEQNKRRKELLAKALAVRTQQTKEEAQKLDAIRDEFKKLDILLSGDVKILRQQIEVASLEYMEAEKRYFKIEKEFLNAKLVLHQKSEKKEMLTEHLCAVIEKNEERKAEKLQELMNKLNLKSDFQDDERARADCVVSNDKNGNS